MALTSEDQIKEYIVQKVNELDFTNISHTASPLEQTDIINSNQSNQQATTIEQLAPVALSDLSETDLQKIQKHPLYRELRGKFGNGKGVVFRLRDYYKNGVAPHNKTWGENNQSHLVARTLKAILPEARIIGNTFDASADYSALGASPDGSFDIHVHDTSENNASLENPESVLKMETLKPANGSLTSIDGKRSRQLLGLKNSDSVMSVYAAKDYNPLEDSSQGGIDKALKANQHVIDIANQLGKTDRDNLRLLFSSSYTAGLHPELAKLYEKQGFKIIDVNDKKALKELPNHKGPALLFNSTRGRLPHIHAAAAQKGMGLVLGPVNAFESLQVGTKTMQLLFDDSYDAKTLKKNNEIGQKSGGYKQIKLYEQSADTIQTAVQELLGGTSPNRNIHLIKDSSGTSPFTKYLNELQKYMQRLSQKK